MSFIAFLIIGMTEIKPNICKVEYMRYVDVETVTIPCDLLKEVKDAEVI